jgi:superfamily II DNA or RNA helicase
MLRPYQNTSVDALRGSILNGHKRIVLCSPTGSGKTRMFCYMVEKHLKKGGKVLIITDRIELLKQAGKDFENILEIKAGHEPDLTKNLHTAMIETLYRRLDRYHNYMATRTMIVIDEAHKQAFNKIFPHIPEDCIVIGASATPLRKGNQEAMDSFYTDMVQIIDTPDLIEQGFLSRAKTYGVDVDLSGIKMKGDDYDTKQMAKKYADNKVYEGVIENYKKICPNTKTILFASNIESSKEISNQFNLAGIPSRHLDSEMLTSERNEVLKWFNETKNGVLCNISILTTGFDEPTIETVILYRATKSLSLFLQMVGRGSRVIPNVKNEFFLLDFGMNIKTHDFWEAPREWSLAKKKKKDKTGAAPVKICPNCKAMLAVSLLECNYCNYKFKSSEDKGKNEIAELKLLTPNERWAKMKGKPISEIAQMAKSKLLSSMKVLHSIEDEKQGIEFCKEMGYKKSFPYVNRHRFKCFEKL